MTVAPETCGTAGPRRVTVVVLGEQTSPSAAEPLAAGQTLPPDVVITAHHGRRGSERNLSEVLSTAARQPATWIWLIDASVRPRADALARLLEACDVDLLGRGLPTVLASMVCSPAGTPCDDALPRGSEHATPLVLAGVEHGLLPIRNTPFVSTLLHRSVVDRHGLPSMAAFGAYAPIEYTARALRTDVGYLVPASVVTAPEPAAQQWGFLPEPSIAQTARMARTGVWTRGERVRAVAAHARLLWARTPQGGDAPIARPGSGAHAGSRSPVAARRRWWRSWGWR